MLLEAGTTKYLLTDDKSKSYADSVLCILHESNALTAVKQALDGEIIPDRFKDLYSLIWSAGGKLTEEMLPPWFDADFKKNSQVLRDVAEVIEYQFIMAAYTVDDQESDIRQCIEDVLADDSRDARSVVQAIASDLLLPKTMTFDENKQAILQKIDAVVEGYRGKSMFSLKFLLLKMSGRKYLTHQDEDCSESVQSLVSCFDQDYLKRLHNRPWSKLEDGYRKQETLGALGNTFERFDLINQAALGVLKLNLSYKSSTKQIAALLNLNTNSGERCQLQQSVQLTTSFKIDSYMLSKAQQDIRLQSTSVSDIVEAVIRSEPAAFDYMVKADFDFLGVYFDQRSQVFRYVLQDRSLDSSILTHTDNFVCIFNSQDKAIADPESFRVIFAYNPDSLAFAESKKYELFWRPSSVDPTIGELAKYLAVCRYGSGEQSSELSRRLMFSTRKMHFSRNDDRTAAVDMHTYGYTEDTLLKKVVQDLGRPENCEKVIDLFCFEEFSGGESASFDFLRSTSEKILNLKPKLQSLINYLFALEERVYQQSKISDTEEEPNHFKDRDLSFYLPNLLFVSVTKVNCGFQLLEDCTMEYLKRKISGELHLSTGYKAIGGIYSEGAAYRPFLVKNGRVLVVLEGGRLEESNIVNKRPEDVIAIAFERITAEIAD